ncbi:hypothetical protein GDO78_018500 [Eleutherodactylus coqui]|uniref:Uncharacterized protein n=1 Tax=Eleutherodactylus coqui TaxID=57060 RepID=A0A8J6BLT2_ELECQ|nr:hypothetical protein GDO78_018500 [Eleutherodactylus coqui]
MVHALPSAQLSLLPPVMRGCCCRIMQCLLKSDHCCAPITLKAIEGLGPIPDLLSQRMKEFELQRGLDPPPWTSFFHSPSPGRPSYSSSSECDSPPAQTSKYRPRTLSLDAKLTSLKSRGLKMAESPSGRGSRRAESPRPQARKSSSSSGSSTPDSERGSQTRKNLKSLKTKLDPRNWLQSQV